METWVIIASGQSLTKEDVEIVRGARASGLIKGFVAVSNVGIDLAPDADALVSHDDSWWRNNPVALDLPMMKFSRQGRGAIRKYVPQPPNGCNSGYMAMQVARDIFKAKRILLLGFDMHGTHYFGKHPSPLKNTSAERFKFHLNQFNSWSGCQVINCTVGSAIKKFPFIPLEKAL